MWVANIGIEEPLEDIGTDWSSLIASQRDHEEVADDDREWKQAADALDYIAELLFGEVQLLSKEDH